MKNNSISFHGLVTLSACLIAPLAFAADQPAQAPKLVTQVCAACHGADGNSAVAMYPKLAGQHDAYLRKQLADFKAGQRKSPVMSPVAATLSKEDMAQLSSYFNGQTPKLGTAKSNGTASKGEKIYRAGIADLNVPACASCHGPTGAGIPVQFPRLAGQHADYTVAQLKLFRSGERVNDPAGMMRAVAAKMSDQDMAAVADYIQGLR